MPNATRRYVRFTVWPETPRVHLWPEGMPPLVVLAVDPGLQTGLALLHVSGSPTMAALYTTALAFDSLPVPAKGERAGKQRLYRSMDEPMTELFDTMAQSGRAGAKPLGAVLEEHRAHHLPFHYAAEAMFWDEATPTIMPVARLEGHLHGALSWQFDFASTRLFTVPEWRESTGARGLKKEEAKVHAATWVAGMFGTPVIGQGRVAPTEHEHEAAGIAWHCMGVLAQEWGREDVPPVKQKAIGAWEEGLKQTKRRRKKRARSVKGGGLPEHLKGRVG